MTAIAANWPIALLIALLCSLGFAATHGNPRVRFAGLFGGGIAMSVLCVLSLYFFAYVDPVGGKERLIWSALLFAAAWWLYRRARRTLHDADRRDR